MSDQGNGTMMGMGCMHAPYSITTQKGVAAAANEHVVMASAVNVMTYNHVD
jgi:hypothetical protein